MAIVFFFFFLNYCIIEHDNKVLMYFLWPDKYVAYTTPHSGAVDKDFDKLSLSNENGFLWDTTSAGSSELLMEDGLPKESISEVGSLTCYPLLILSGADA